MFYVLINQFMRTFYETTAKQNSIFKISSTKAPETMRAFLSKTYTLDLNFDGKFVIEY